MRDEYMAKLFALGGATGMKDLFTVFSSAVFFPTLTLVLPGLTMISSWFVLSMRSLFMREVVRCNHTETAFILMLLSLFAGTVIDDLGMRIESCWLDRQRDARTKGLHFEEWWAYLRKPVDIEPSGRRHLRRLVARLKFELGIPVALVATLPGVWLNASIHLGAAAGITLGAISLSLYLLLEAAATHEALGILRHELLRYAESATFSQPSHQISA
jgi:hypothetical protein